MSIMLGLGLGLTSRGRPYAAAAPPFTPLDLGSALIAWWDAGDHGTARMTDDGAGLISSWTDKKGSLPYTATTTQRPTWSTTAFDAAYAGLTFDGVGNFMTGALTGFPVGSAECWLFALIDQTSSATAQQIFQYGTTGNTFNRQIVKTAANRFSVSIQGGVISDTAHTFTGPHFVEGGFSGTTLTGFFDGDPTTPATNVAVTIATGTTRGRIMADCATSPVGFGKGALRHMFLCGPVTTLQRQQLEGWALRDVGRASQLPVGHPYKSAAP